MTGRAFAMALAALALSGLLVPDARAGEAPAKAAKTKPRGELGPEAAALAQLVAERSLPASLSAARKASLGAIAAKAKSGDVGGAKAAWQKFAKASGLDPEVLRALARWVVREGMLEPNAELTELADQARFHSEATRRCRAGLVLLRAAATKIKGAKTISVKLVTSVPYAKFKSPVTEVDVSLTAAEVKAAIADLEASTNQAEEAAAKAEDAIKQAKDHATNQREAIRKMLDLLREMNEAVAI